MEIRHIEENEIGFAQGMFSESWDSDLFKLFRKYSNDRRFHPLAVFKNGDMAAFGQALVFGKTAWLGNICVKNEYRRQGIGTALTSELVDRCLGQGAGTVTLSATYSGEGLYKKLGFIDDTLYVFYRGVFSGEISSSISPIHEKEKRTILNIHYRVTGEDKDTELLPYLDSGFKITDRYNEITGFYLPDYGNGLVLAMTDYAGSELLKFKHINRPAVSVLSEENEAGVDFMEGMEFRKTGTAKRMYLGEYNEWHPQNLFSRGTTYSG
jgi:GNAT superfamily N-acetyltransferase